MTMPRWKKNLIEFEAKRKIKKQSKEFRKRITPLMNFLVSLMETATDKEAQTLAIYICAEVILGFEKEDERNFVYEALGETIKNAE